MGTHRKWWFIVISSSLKLVCSIFKHSQIIQYCNWIYIPFISHYIPTKSLLKPIKSSLTHYSPWNPCISHGHHVSCLLIHSIPLEITIPSFECIYIYTYIFVYIYIFILRTTIEATMCLVRPLPQPAASYEWWTVETSPLDGLEIIHRQPTLGH